MIDLIVTSSAARCKFLRQLKTKTKLWCELLRGAISIHRRSLSFAKALGRPCLLLKYSKWDAQGNEPEMPHVFQEEKEIFDVLNEWNIKKRNDQMKIGGSLDRGTRVPWRAEAASRSVASIANRDAITAR